MHYHKFDCIFSCYLPLTKLDFKFYIAVVVPTYVFQRLRLALFKWHNRVDVSHALTWGRKQIQFRKRCVLLRSLEYRSKNPVIRKYWRVKLANEIMGEKFVMFSNNSMLVQSICFNSFCQKIWHDLKALIRFASRLRYPNITSMSTETLKRSVFWDITPCSQLKVNGHFEGTYHLYIQGRRISQARGQQEAGSKQSTNSIWGKMT
jgi:hypothetical protein